MITNIIFVSFLMNQRQFLLQGTQTMAATSILCLTQKKLNEQKINNVYKSLNFTINYMLNLHEIVAAGK